MSFFIHWKAYSLFPRLNNLELILLIKALLLHGLKPRPLLYNGQKSSKLSPEARVRKLVSQLLILCFWELLRRFSPPFFVLAVFLISGFYLTINNYLFSDHYEPGNHSKNQRFHCVTVECTSHEVWSARFLDMLGAIHSTKISGNFGPKLNGSVRSNPKNFEKTGPPFEVDHFSRSEFWLNRSRSLLKLPNIEWASFVL